jgi:NADPH:quinone reductase-like Zn-dependent oxidoreductase
MATGGAVFDAKSTCEPHDMRAVVYRRFGAADVLELTRRPKPVPRPDEVLIRIFATTVTTADWRARSLNVPRGFGPLARLVFGITKPRYPVLGNELAGEVEATGGAVKRFKPGDQVVGYTGVRFGCHAEYRCMPENGALVLKPANLSFEEAAALSFGGVTALLFLRRAKIKQGGQVLVNGASGAVGSAAVQLAKHFGATVTAVCSTPHVERVKALGADEVIDYTREDFTASGKTWDIIVDTAGTARFPRVRRSLNEGGRLLAILGALPDMLSSPWVRLTTSKQIIAGTFPFGAEELQFVARLAASGEFKPLIGKRFSFAQIADAHREVDTGHKLGTVSVSVP